MRHIVQRYVAECAIYQTHQYSNLSPVGLLQPIKIPTQIWKDLSMDFIEGLPLSRGVNVILLWFETSLYCIKCGKEVCSGSDTASWISQVDDLCKRQNLSH